MIVTLDIISKCTPFKTSGIRLPLSHTADIVCCFFIRAERAYAQEHTNLKAS